MPSNKRNKLCPYKRLCRNACYGENPCNFAKVFDGLQTKIDHLKTENQKLKSENEKLTRRLEANLESNHYPWEDRG